MNLDEILAIRAIPAGGVFLSVTRRCPLTCAHCSTNSLITSEEHPADLFLRFADTFTAADHPGLLLLTGGEALLRPALVEGVIERCHRAGTPVGLISGLYFARQPTIPSTLRRSIDAVDHFTASLDVYHERQIPRSDVFRVLQELLDAGKDLSIQIAGLEEDQPYIDGVVADIDRTFEGRVPFLVTQVHPVGRAREWVQEEPIPVSPVARPQPCAEAAWPVVTFDGTVVACSNQTIVDGPGPPHLRLGHTSVDDWPTVRDRMLQRTLPRAIRLWGPEYIAERYGTDGARCDGYCETCFQLSDHPEVAAGLEPALARESIDFVQQQVIAMAQGALVSMYGHKSMERRRLARTLV